MKLGYIIKEARYYGKVTGLSRAGKKFLLTQTPLSNVVNGPLYSKHYRKEIIKKSSVVEPTILQIENTNFCNAKCIMCPHIIMKRKQKIMNQKNFQIIVDNVLKRYKIKRLVLNGFGEPFIDKEIIEKIKYVNENYPSIKIEIYTNASLLTEEITNKLLKTNLDRITFSINGTKKNYNKIMSLDYDKTMKNLMFLLKEKKRKKKNILTNISLMILDDNKEDIDKFMKYWCNLADSVRAYPPNDWAGGVKNIINNSPFKIKKRWPCFFIWSNITVDVEGNVIMCCRDYESKIIFGNLLKQDIGEIRNSEKFRQLQNYHLQYNFSIPVCNICDNITESSLDWIC